MDASRRPLRAVEGLSDAGMRQIRGTRKPKPNSRAGATPRRYIATIVSTTRRGHRSRGKFGDPDPAAFCRAICGIATNAASRSSRPRVARWTTTSNLIAVRRLLLAPDDPEVCGPAPAATLPPAPQTSHDVGAPAAARRDRSRTQAATTSWGLMARVRTKASLDAPVAAHLLFARSSGVVGGCRTPALDEPARALELMRLLLLSTFSLRPPLRRSALRAGNGVRSETRRAPPSSHCGGTRRASAELRFGLARRSSGRCGGRGS